MKKMRKILAILLTFIMVMGLATTTLADVVKYTITAPETEHKYEIYQIFTGDLSENILSNVKWGLNGKETTGEEVSKEILTELENLEGKTDADKLAVITTYADLTTQPVGTVTNGSSLEVPAGYYLIKDVNDSVSGNDVYTTYIVKIVGDVNIETKSDVPEVEKKVKDTNDSAGTTSAWQDSADYDIGDNISFKLTASLPENYDDYKAYKLVFNDTFSGMSEPKITKVYLVDADGTEVAEFATEDYAFAEAENRFTVTFSNLKTTSIATKIENSYKVVIEYTAQLDETAEIGAGGNTNSVYLDYSNNPNEDADGEPSTGTTPPDKVVVFTYKLIVDKVNDTNEPLAGAGFTLYKKTGTDENDEPIWTAVGEEINGTELTQFTWTGLDDGEYKLEETTTPAGYNTIVPIEFTITATHDTESDDPQLEKLETTFTNANVDKEAGIISATVQNNKGATLPETGGIGTTIFYIVGAILVIGAAVVMITRKRMDA